MIKKINKNLNYTNQHQKQTGAGFTLIELLVTISIIGIISTLSLVYYRGASSNSVLRLEAYKVAGDLRRLQNMALGAQEYRDSVPVGGWGIKIIDTDTYVIFADVNDDGDYDPVGSDCPAVAGECFETVDLDNNATFVISSIDDIILFIPPDPLTYIYDDSVVDEIILQFEDVEGNTQDIDVNFLGLIDIKD